MASLLLVKSMMSILRDECWATSPTTIVTHGKMSFIAKYFKVEIDKEHLKIPRKVPIERTLVLIAA